MISRKIKEYTFKMLSIFALLIISIIIISFISFIIIKGLSSILYSLNELNHINYLINAAFGSIYLSFFSTFIGFIVSLPIVFLLKIYLKQSSKISKIIRFSLNILWGIPSIIYGALGFNIMVILGLKASLLSGIITITILIIPIIIKAIDEESKDINLELLESSYSLGATKLEISLKIYLKKLLPIIISTFLLAFGRAIGDAAAILITIGYSERFPSSFLEKTSTLPLSIYYNLNNPDFIIQNSAYSSLFLLFIIVVTTSIFSRILIIKKRNN